uniref:Uncharacterized protein n=1 Tax=Arion vulgaris TaxID=1028688 RepID=A0A0B7BP16_9EUPU
MSLLKFAPLSAMDECLWLSQSPIIKFQYFVTTFLLKSLDNRACFPVTVLNLFPQPHIICGELTTEYCLHISSYGSS